MTETPNLQRILDIMARLRDPKHGCPWDREQNFATIAPYTIEEAYEVADAIEKRDMAALKDELGDLLFQVVFHARMAEEQGSFKFDDVAAAISDKMIRRHPHVFGDEEIRSPAQQTVAWEAQKAVERSAAVQGTVSALDGVSVALPALTRALKLQRRAARVGFDWVHAWDIFAKIEEEIAELQDEIDQEAPIDRLEDELGDLLFAVTNLARRLEVDPETALRRGTSKFERRFKRVEELLLAQGKSPEASNLDEMETLWQEVKSEEA